MQLLDCPDVEGFEAFTFNLSTPSERHDREGEQPDQHRRQRHTWSRRPRSFARDAVVDEKDGNALVSVLLGGTGGQVSEQHGHRRLRDSATEARPRAATTPPPAARSPSRPGQTAKTVVVPIADDGANEPAESFTLALSNPNGATISRGTGTVTIGANDATPVSQPGISAPPDVAVGEGDGFVDLHGTPLRAGSEHGVGQLHDPGRHCRRRHGVQLRLRRRLRNAQVRAGRDDQGRARADPRLSQHRDCRDLRLPALGRGQRHDHGRHAQ